MSPSASEVFLKSDDMEWEPAGDGMQRQVLGYDEGLMLVRVRFDQGAVGELHSHPHRQVTYVESGSFEVEIDGEKQILGAGDGFYVPPDTDHGAVALEPGCLIDVFAPLRRDILAAWNGSE